MVFLLWQVAESYLGSRTVGLPFSFSGDGPADPISSMVASTTCN